MEEYMKDYILKQYASIGCLQEILNSLAFDKDNICNDDYMLIAISSQFSYREDWLRAHNLTMTLEEYKLWETFRKQYEPKPDPFFA